MLHTKYDRTLAGTVVSSTIAKDVASVCEYALDSPFCSAIFSDHTGMTIFITVHVSLKYGKVLAISTEGLPDQLGYDRELCSAYAYNGAEAIIFDLGWIEDECNITNSTSR